MSTMDTNEFVEPGAGFTSSIKPGEHTRPASVQDEDYLSNSFKEEEFYREFSGTTASSQASGASYESPVHNMSLIQSPLVQVMERSEGYDSGRIPSSVFDRSKSISPMDWSVASNESLFSIHIENNSFSRDQPLMLGELSKSGELVKEDELIVFSPPPPIQLGDIDRNNLETGRKYEASSLTDDCSKHDEETPKVRKDSWDPLEISPQSSESGNSTKSFCFPIWKEEEQSGFAKEDSRQHFQFTSSKAHSKSVYRKYFYCFSCPYCSLPHCSCCCSFSCW